ncbi:Cmx/CmrA family chloramphenicol efflux MFS transporter [Streptomyces sp. NPDC097619]|uniref:Cmx/CmrA family chloramphenicol efflux MFS transporter n=1 Tax=Streptomyces sp. NPDC097619 TaxID=3157228 RepID=UPI003332D869
MPLPLYVLALAVFAMGTSEFMLAGLLPALAADLGVTVATAGTLTSAYAIGMVVGAPLMAVLVRDRSGRSGLLGFVLVFLAAHALAATTTRFPVLFAARVVAAFANAGFLALALTTAAALVPADRTGRAIGVLLSGTTAAMVAGVPGGSLLGQQLGWRAAFWAVALACLPAALGIMTCLPKHRGPAGGSGGTERAAFRLPLRAELSRLGQAPVLLIVLLTALVNAGTFAGLTFLAPVVTGTAGLPASWVPVTLMLFGVGSFLGVSAAGRLSDRRPGLVLGLGGPLLPVGWAALALLADRPAPLLLLVTAQGALSFAVGGTLITRILHRAAGAPTLAGATATAALNIGAVAGPVLGGVALDTAAGPLGPLWASGSLAALAVLLALPLRAALVPDRSGRPLR